MAELFQEAFELMLAGMGVVFTFLLILTGVVALLTRLCPETPVNSSDSSASQPAPPKGPSQAAKLAAVTVAVQKYRQARGRADRSKE
ncbi:OadG family protein [Aliidiomarina sanyensis]|uniref:Probable oxaloacetate decarboxylase gamma chain n=1 Tax=Aliidiomarina sanyensis TaxID=1249555 RepID=A0A432WNJ9_9GAMM|nr:OadG family transporter subunit [Aliidiomarina sanyensis]RUO35289.1 hypothetical protein CWE11_04490 [Aliidiomarina sanyensis]